MSVSLFQLPVKYPDERLRDLYEEARREKFPVVEPEVGSLLHLMVKISKPKLIVEFGSGFGYSALWMALACPHDCLIYCIDYQQKNRKRALKLFDLFGVSEKITYLVGEAMTVFFQLGFEKESIDLFFFDHEKQNYSESLDLVLPKLKVGGILVADDVLWKGRVFDENETSPRLKALRFFLRELFHRKELYSLVLPLGDGVSVSVKRF